MVLVFVGLFVLSACGDTEPEKAAGGGSSGAAMKPGGSGGAGAGGGSVAGSGGAADATDFVAAYCGALRSCCQIDGFPTEPLASCEMDAKQQINVFAGLERGTVVTTSQLPACIAALQGIAPGCGAADSSFVACARAFNGTVDEGGECVKVVDCKRGEHPVICLKLSGAEDKGVCHELKPAGLDAPCSISADSASYYGLTYSTSAAVGPPLAYCSVAAGHYCDLDAEVCRARLPATTACTAREQCEDGLICDETCQEPKPDGSACTSSLACGPASRCIDAKCQPARFVAESVCEGDLD